MSTAHRHDPKAHFLAQRGALHPHPEQVQDALFRGGTFFDPRDLIQVRYEMVRRYRIDGQPAPQVARSFGVSRQSLYLLARAFRDLGLPGLVPTQARTQGAPTSVPTRCWPSLVPACRRVPRADPRRAAHRRSGSTWASASIAAHWNGDWRPGKKTPQADPAVESAVPSSLDLTARYERLRAGVLLRGSPDSHEAALVVHRGIPGWLDFARRLGEGRSPPDPPRADAPAGPERTPPAALPCHRELVPVLASVVRHCLEANP